MTQRQKIGIPNHSCSIRLMTDVLWRHRFIWLKLGFAEDQLICSKTNRTILVLQLLEPQNLKHRLPVWWGRKIFLKSGETKGYWAGLLFNGTVSAQFWAEREQQEARSWLISDQADPLTWTTCDCSTSSRASDGSHNTPGLVLMAKAQKHNF